MHTKTTLWLGAAIAGTLLAASSASAALVLRYTFDEASSGNANALDSSASAPNNGIFNAGATRTSATPGGASLGAMYDPGTGGTSLTSCHVKDTNNVLKNTIGNGSFTMSLWLNLQGTPNSSDALISNTGSSNGLLWQIRNPSSGTLAANNFALRLLSRQTSTDVASLTNSSSLDADQRWLFIAVTYDSSTNGVQFYSGTEITAVAPAGAATTIAGTNAAGATAATTKIGASDRGANMEPNAFFDDVRLYSNVLSSTDLDLVRQENVPEPASLGLLGLGGVVALARRRMR